MIKLIQNKDLAHGPNNADDPLMNKVGKVMSSFEEADVLAHGTVFIYFVDLFFTFSLRKTTRL